MKKKTLMRSFTIFSLIAFLITGALLSYQLIDHVKNDMLNSLLENTTIRLEEYVTNSLDIGEINTSDVEGFDKVYNDNLKDYFIGFRLLDKNNKVKYSSFEPELNDYLDKTLFTYNPYQEKPSIRIFDVNNQSEKNDLMDGSKIIFAYIPVKSELEVAGAYQVLIPYSMISSHLNVLYKIIFTTIFIGLLLLYLLLLEIIYKSSKSLEKQNIELLNKSKELEISYEKISIAYRSTITALSNAVDARDSYTAGHSDRVAKISLLIGQSLGISKEQLKTLETAALFHDIGKLGVPDKILNKNDKLLDEEYDVIKMHPMIGVNILNSIDFLTGALMIIRNHHERVDGKGYPDGKSGDEIPLESRIIAVADTYDAITSDRPYRPGLSHEIAISEIVNNIGKQFDPNVVDAFLKVHKEILKVIQGRQ